MECCLWLYGDHLFLFWVRSFQYVHILVVWYLELLLHFRQLAFQILVLWYYSHAPMKLASNPHFWVQLWATHGAANGKLYIIIGLVVPRGCSKTLIRVLAIFFSSFFSYSHAGHVLALMVLIDSTALTRYDSTIGYNSILRFYTNCGPLRGIPWEWWSSTSSLV